MSDILTRATKALRTEIAGLEGLLNRLDGSFEKAVQMVLNCKGKLVVTGMGKSGHIGQKISATFSSTGTPSFFLHPAEAIHGDLGMVEPTDIVLALSNSGNTEEVVRLLGPLRRIGVPLIAMTGAPDSELARRAEVHLDASVAQEACPLGLAPTASTTAALALGDALAVVLLEMRGFSPEDYAMFHPGGNLGKKLMTTVADLMDTGEKIPIVTEETPIRQAIAEIQQKRYGLTAVVNGQNQLTGVFSMGDFTRLHLEDGNNQFMDDAIKLHISASPRTITEEQLAARALHTMENHNIRALFVVDRENHPIGIIGLYEVLKAIDY